MMETGTIRGTGKFIKSVIVDENGNKKEEILELPEEIHTFAAWKKSGRAVEEGFVM